MAIKKKKENRTANNRIVNKKGSIEMQFNWIFILIVGGLILAFFFMAIQGHKKVVETNIDAELRQKLQTIFVSGQESAGITHKIKLPLDELRFSVEGFEIGEIEPIRFSNAFAPKKMSPPQNTFYVTSYPFNMPFHVTNLLFVTTKDNKYYFFNKTNSDKVGTTGKWLGELAWNPKTPSMPKELDIKPIQKNINECPPPSGKTVMIKITGESSGKNLEDCPAEEGVVVEIIPMSGGIDGWGKIIFYEEGGNNKYKKEDPLIYKGREMILAAIYSGNREIYVKGMEDVLYRMIKVGEVYKRKADILSKQASADEPSGFSRCDMYNTPRDDINSLIEQSKEGYAKQEIYEDNNINSKENIIKYAFYVDSDNKNLGMKSCPLIY